MYTYAWGWGLKLVKKRYTYILYINKGLFVLVKHL